MPTNTASGALTYLEIRVNLNRHDLVPALESSFHATIYPFKLVAHLVPKDGLVAVFPDQTARSFLYRLAGLLY